MILSLPSLLAVTASFATAQIPQTPTPSTLPTEWRVPIHTHDDDPDFGAYGTWAAGPGFKASFHEGFEFVPILGPDAPCNLPVAWRTADVRWGDQSLMEGARSAATHHHDEWRYEYHLRPGVVEAYDVEAAGVEQSFVIHRPRVESAGGPLTVVGQFTTSLTPTPTPVGANGQSAFDFVDAKGRTVVRYGEAIAFDANGEQTSVTTELVGLELTHTVPAEFVANATWPITIDPLLSPFQITAPPGAITDCDIEFGETPGSFDQMIAFVVAASSTDHDLYILIENNSFTNAYLVFTEIATFDSIRPAVAFCDGAGLNGKWVVAFERSSATISGIRVRVHDAGSITQNGSTMILPMTEQGATYRNPDIGGGESDTALLVYQTDVTSTQANTAGTEVRYAYCHPDSLIFSGFDIVASAPSLISDREEPSVIRRSYPSVGDREDWVVCYQQRTPFLSNTWGIRGQRISLNWPKGTDTQIVTSTSTSSPHLIRPEVEGGSYVEYMVTAMQAQSTSSTSGTAVVSTPFRWGAGGLQSTDPSQVTLSAGLLFDSIRDFSIAFDYTTTSHWGVCVRRALGSISVARVGFDGTASDVDTTLTQGGTAASICHNPTNANFSHVYGVSGPSNDQLFIIGYDYSPDAITVPIGASCGGTMNFPTPPYLGTDLWRVNFAGGQPSVPLALFVAFSPVVIDLTPIGMTNCNLLVGPTDIVSIPTATAPNGFGNAFIPLSAAGDLYLQWAHIAIGENPLGVQTSDGWRAQVR